jgi:hypothetical protein
MAQAKNGIYSNAYNIKWVQRNQKLFGEWKEYLSSFHLNILSIDSAELPHRIRGLSLGIKKKKLHSL